MNPRAIPPGRPGGPGRGLIPVLLVVFGVIWLVGRGTSFWVDWLWWHEDVRQGATFRRLLEAEWGWGMAFGAATLVFTALNLWLARRAASNGSRAMGIPGKVAAGLLLFFAAQAGFGFGARHWPAILLWQHRQPFGLAEPIFGKDAGFYVFTLPLAERIGGWALGILFLNAIAVTVIFLTGAAGGLGLAPTGVPGQWTVVRKEPATGVATHWNRLLTHLSILGVVVFVVFALQAQLAAWGLMFSAQGVVHGPGWTDVHVRIPAYRILIGALALGALLFVRAAVAHTLKATVQAILAGVGLAAAVWLLGVNFLPGLVQRYRVSPNEPTLETPYMRHNMGFTRHAFGLADEDVETRDFPQIVPPRAETLVADSLTLANMRLWDWRALESTYDQNQSFRQYYDFYDVDIDRYTVGGATSQVMLALREMNQSAFSENAVTWVNLRMVYTHGYGLCLNPTNEFTPEGLPNYWVRDIPPVSTDPALRITRPEIYYGELTRGPVYVKTGQKEFDYPQGDQNAYSTYEGLGGLRLGSGLRRLVLALHLDGIKQLTSADLTADSRLMLRRQVHERVRAVAPFLRLDEDPYAVILDGRLGIVFDGYTVSDHFPYSERLSGGLNYIRNSVKILVDCYDGTVTLYAVDEDDPVLKAWRGAFPGLFLPGSAMPAGLRAHLRYPEDLLNLQAHVYATYHMTDPMVFYNKEDRWAVARESIGQNEPAEMLPYYAVLRLPGESATEFVQLIPFTPFTARGAPRHNMIGWMAGRCDGEHYGKLLVYRFPKQSLVYGPMQIEARIDQDAVIAKDLTLWNQQGSNVIRGNLLVVPLENGLLYTKPIFLQATHSRMPELKRVVVASQERLGYGASYAEALADLVEQPLPGALYRAVTGRWPEGGLTPAPADSGRAPDVSSPHGGPTPPVDRASLAEARRLYRRYLELMGAGRVGEAGAVLEELGRVLGSRAGSAEN